MFSYGRTSFGRPTITDLRKLCIDTGCSLEDLREAIDDRDEWRESDSRKSVLAVRHDDNDNMSN